MPSSPSLRGEELAFVLDGFRAFDFISSRSVQPSIITVTSNSVGLLQEVVSTNTTLLYLNLPAEALGGSVTFSNSGPDSLSIAVISTYVPTTVNPGPSPIKVSKVIRGWNITSNSAYGAPINSANLGELGTADLALSIFSSQFSLNYV